MRATDEQLAHIKELSECKEAWAVDREALAAILAELTELRDKLELCHHENCDLSAKVDGIPWLRAEVERLKAKTVKAVDDYFFPEVSGLQQTIRKITGTN